MARLNTRDHHGIAQRLGVDHGQAVLNARETCPSGWAAGAHGGLCPCQVCTTIEVLRLALADAEQQKENIR